MITIYDVETGDKKEVTQKEFEMLNLLDVVFYDGIHWCFDSLPVVERVLADIENAGEN